MYSLGLVTPLIHPMLPIAPAELASVLVPPPKPDEPAAPLVVPTATAPAPEWFDAPLVAAPSGTPLVHPVVSGLRITEAPLSPKPPGAILTAGAGRWWVLLALAGALLVRRRV